MDSRVIGFAGSFVKICSYSEDITSFLDLLFLDLNARATNNYAAQLTFAPQEAAEGCALFSGATCLFSGRLGVRAAAILYDTVIFNLLNCNGSGVALHAGAVTHRGKLILVPGESGAGKSSVVARLVADGFGYATDELIFFSDHEMTEVLPFTRPICLKAGSVEAVGAIVGGFENEVLCDEDGAIIAHRLLNPDFSRQPHLPALLLFPRYRKNGSMRLEKLSGAQAGTRLMNCCVNGRNVPGHGFRQVVTLARSLPAYQLSYSSLSDFDTLVRQLIRMLAV